MATAPLAVLVPILAATLLAATSPVARRPLAIVVALAAAAALVVLAAITLGRAAGGTLVAWFGGWEPRRGVALGSTSPWTRSAPASRCSSARSVSWRSSPRSS